MVSVDVKKHFNNNKPCQQRTVHCCLCYVKPAATRAAPPCRILNAGMCMKALSTQNYNSNTMMNGAGAIAACHWRCLLDNVGQKDATPFLSGCSCTDHKDKWAAFLDWTALQKKIKKKTGLHLLIGLQFLENLACDSYS